MELEPAICHEFGGLILLANHFEDLPLLIDDTEQCVRGASTVEKRTGTEYCTMKKIMEHLNYFGKGLAVSL